MATAADLASLKRLQTQITRNERYTTKQKEFLLSLIRKPIPTTANELTSLILELREALQTFEDYARRFEDLFQQYEVAADQTDTTNDLTDDIERCSDMVMQHVACLNKAKVHLTELERQERHASIQNQSPPTQSSTASGTNPNPNDVLQLLLNALSTSNQSASQPSQATPGLLTANGTSIKLPKLSLPKFDGDLMKWKPFWDRFETSIDTHPTMRNVEKLSYLMGLLEGEPLKMVEALPLTNENYTVSITLLKEKYGRPKTLIAALYRRLNDIKPIANNAEQLRSFCSEIECVLGSLSAFGQNINDDNFVTIILSKLPSDLVMTLEMSKDVNIEWTVTSLRKGLNDQVIRMDAAERSSSKTSANTNFHFSGEALVATEVRKPFAKGKPYTKSPNPRQFTQPTPRQYSKPLPPAPCVFCSEKHWSDQCTKYKTTNERHKVLHNRCTLCLREGHKKAQCTSLRPCFYCKKTKSHHSALCFTKFGPHSEIVSIAEDGVTSSLSNPPEKTETVITNASIVANEVALLTSDERVILQTASVKVSDPVTNANVTIRLLLDTAASRSYVSSKLAKQLGLKVTTGKSIAVHRFATDKKVFVETKQANLFLELQNGKMFPLKVTVLPKITGSLVRSPINIQSVLQIANKLQLADTLPKTSEEGEIDLLLGTDYYLDLITGERLQVCNGLYLLGSKLGWILTGRISDSDTPSTEITLCGFTNVNQPDYTMEIISDYHGVNQVKPDIECLWKLDALGIQDDPNTKDDDKALEMFQSTIQFNNARYEVKFPSKDELQNLPTNYKLSLGRLHGLVKRLKQSPEIAQKYDEIIKDQLAKGVIEKVDTKNPSGPLQHYIPHHCVVTPNKATTKVRIVYDGSAKSDRFSPSINECLLRGPVMLDNLCGLLLRFRFFKVALIADIEKAFLQVGLQAPDRDLTRFLWLDNPKNFTVENNLAIYRFCRVPFGIISSPFLLSATVDYHLRQYPQSICANQIVNNIYVDNVIFGAKDDQEAWGYYQEAKLMFGAASMNLREWSSNSKKLLQQIPTKDKAVDTKFKVLGMYWDSVSDTMFVSSKVSKDKEPKTKRELLSQLSSIFDPLGLFLPITIKGKLLLQNICKRKASWDEKITIEEKKAWQSLTSDLVQIPLMSFPRYLGEITGGTADLVAFCDASESCYATAVYIRIKADSKVSTNLIFAKSRVNPLRKMSIPRLELMAVLIGSRALSFVEKQLRIKAKHKFILTDSMCVFSWLKSEKPKETFVRNRVKEIQRIPGLEIRYVATDHNPADIATRGKEFSELDSFWWQGPTWLVKSYSEWPTWNTDNYAIDNGNIKVEKDIKPLYSMTVAATTEELIPPFDINASHYSSYLKLLRVTAWCFRFGSQKAKRTCPLGKHLTPKEIQTAKDHWDRFAQRKHYQDIFKALQENKSHKFSHLNLKIDDKGALRCHGRLGNASISLEAKFPKLLPYQEKYTELMVRYVHEKSSHAGVAQCLSILRKEYWLPKARKLTKSVIASCGICKKYQGKSYSLPMMPDLPACRVTRQLPFTYVGLDYFGPITIKQPPNIIKKVWIALFTCLTIRAIHLEMVYDMTSHEFLLALRRFVAKRGKPHFIISDNAPTFKLVQSILDEIWVDVKANESVVTYLSNTNIKWETIPAFSPWSGGVYERLVGVVKMSLRKALGKGLYVASQLQTLLAETEVIVNCRPLSYVEDDINSLTVISPSHFLNVNPQPFTLLDFDDKDLPFEPVVTNTTELLKLWKTGQNILNQFWDIWQDSYLLSLREKHTSQHRSNPSRPFEPKVGHMVVIKDELLPRGAWRVGRITELNKSTDGKIRSVKLILPSKRVICRPVNLLCPFELTENISSQELEKELHDLQRPKRKAAVSADRQIQEYFKTFG